MVKNKRNKLKIAVVIRNFVTTGGAERYAYEVTKRLTAFYDIHVFCQTFDESISKGIVFHKIPKICSRPSFVNQLLFSVFTNRAIDSSFDVIHSHERVSRFDVLTIHCPCFRGFITNTKNGWRKALVWLGALTSLRCLAYLWLEKNQFKEKSKRRLIAVSQTVKNDVIYNYQVPDASFNLAYPGVDFKSETTVDPKVLRKKYKIHPDDIVVLFVGSEFKRKGLDALIQAMSLIDSEHIKLLVVGGGDVEKYKELACCHGIGERVFFTGLIKNVFSYYAAADIFILPTLSDPCPMAPLEAMACGLATIMSKTPYCGTAEHITKKEAVLLENPSDSKEIAKSITILEDSGHRSQLAEKGKSLARQISWEKTTGCTVKAYEDFLKSI